MHNFTLGYTVKHNFNERIIYCDCRRAFVSYKFPFAINFVMRVHEHVIYFRRKNDQSYQQNCSTPNPNLPTFTYFLYPLDLIDDLVTALEDVNDEIGMDALKDVCSAEDIKSDLFWGHKSTRGCSACWFRCFRREFADTSKVFVRLFDVLYCRIDELY